MFIEHDNQSSPRSSLNYGKLFTTALGVGVALGWNGAVRASIQATYPHHDGAVFAHFRYAIVITVIAVLLLYMARVFESPRGQTNDGVNGGANTNANANAGMNTDQMQPQRECLRSRFKN
jgi:hypothetical protein